MQLPACKTVRTCFFEGSRRKGETERARVGGGGSEREKEREGGRWNW